MSGGIPDDIRERHRVMNEADDDLARATDWEIENYKDRPRPFRRRYTVSVEEQSDYVVNLVHELRRMVEEVSDHGLVLRVDVHGLRESPAFDGLAACADSVQELRTASGRSFRCAKWDTGRGEVALYGGEAGA